MTEIEHQILVIARKAAVESEIVLRRIGATIPADSEFTISSYGESAAVVEVTGGTYSGSPVVLVADWIVDEAELKFDATFWLKCPDNIQLELSNLGTMWTSSRVISAGNYHTHSLSE